MTILVTGAAGFIGYHVCQALLAQKKSVFGIDNLNDYYDVNLKKARLAQLKKQTQFTFQLIDIVARKPMIQLFSKQTFTTVIHLAAQASVRYSLKDPHSYIDNNVVGFMNVLEGCRVQQVDHLIYASTSSVYGANKQQPSHESSSCNHPLAIYAATKKANELMAHSYANLYQLPCTGLRFFTVYGPWGRPDMALFKFTKNILNGKPIDVYNHGNMTRDFTYIDDIANGILSLIDKPAQPDPNWDHNTQDSACSYAPYSIYNIGNGHPVSLLDYIHAIEQALGKSARYHMMPLQSGDALTTHADTTRLQKAVDYQPYTNIQTGIARFVTWYRQYYKI